MEAEQFVHTLFILDDPIYKAQVLSDMMEDMRNFSTLQLKFDLHVFTDEGEVLSRKRTARRHAI